MKPTISKRKDLRGRRIVAHVARFGPVRAEGATPQEAADRCELEVRAALERLDHGPTIGSCLGHVYMVWPDVAGWSYWCDVFSRADYRVNGNDRDDCLQSVLMHLAAHVWNYDCSDDRAFVEQLAPAAGRPGLTEGNRRDLLGRLQWYRDMRRLRAAGYSDTDARDILSGFKRQDDCTPVPTAERPAC